MRDAAAGETVYLSVKVPVAMADWLAREAVRRYVPVSAVVRGCIAVAAGADPVEMERRAGKPGKRRKHAEDV